MGDSDTLREHTERLIRLEQKTDAAAHQLHVITGLLNRLTEERPDNGA